MHVSFDHFHLRSPDPEAAAAFYATRLGAIITGRLDNAGALRVVLSLGGIQLFIEAVPATTPHTPAAPFVGIEHFGVLVADLDAACAELRAHGVKFLVEPMAPRPGMKIAFIEGPDGVRIELLQRGP